MPTVLVNVIVNMSQMSAMVEGIYGAVGLLPPASMKDSTGLLVVTVVATAVTLAAAVLGGYKRVEKIMTALLLVILASFLVVAIKGLMDWSHVARAGRAAWCRRCRPMCRSSAMCACAADSRRSSRSPDRRCRPR